MTITSNCFGRADELHAAGVGEHVGELDVGEAGACVAVTTSFQSTPDFITLRFSIEQTRFAAHPRHLEGDGGDALDLEGVVDLGVDGALLAVAEVGDRLRLAEVDAAGQLADDQDVEPLDELALQRGEVGERVEALGRAQVGEEPEVLAQPQQAGLRAGRRRATLSHFGPPTAPSSTASAACARAIVASEIAAPWAS